MSCYDFILENIEMLQKQILYLIDKGEPLTSPRVLEVTRKLEEFVNICQRLGWY